MAQNSTSCSRLERTAILVPFLDIPTLPPWKFFSKTQHKVTACHKGNSILSSCSTDIWLTRTQQ